MATKSAPVDSFWAETPLLEDLAAPTNKPELYDVLRNLYRCVRNKKRVDALTEESRRLNRTSPEALDTFKLMDRFVQDAESMQTFSCSLVSPPHSLFFLPWPSLGFSSLWFGAAH